jgi:hypothetical protein
MIAISMCLKWPNPYEVSSCQEAITYSRSRLLSTTDCSGNGRAKDFRTKPNSYRKNLTE